MDNSNNEIWKDIIGFEQYYQVSNLGRVRSKDRIVITPKTSYFKKGRILIPSLDSKGNYLFVGLHVNNKVKLIYIHRLVAQNFIPNPLLKIMLLKRKLYNIHLMVSILKNGIL